MDKKTIFISIGLYIVAASLSFVFFQSSAAPTFLSPVTSTYVPPTSEDGTVVDSAEPRTEECPLNGEMMTAKQKALWETRRPLGVMIENHKEARPQSGLSSADVIYEAVAEGGITRFLAMYYCRDAKTIGPVRSARIYFMSMLAEYGKYPLYAHVGGANTPGPADALGKVNTLNWDSYNDLNQFAVPFPYYWRDYDRLPDRATEHTMYSSTTKLWEYAAKKRNLTNVDENNKAWDETFVKYKFKEDDDTKGTVTNISFNFWETMKADFSVDWAYDTKANTFKRINGGEAHLDKNTGKQLTAKNVVVLFMTESPANDGYEGGHLLYKTTGTGKAITFMDGKAIEGTWSKKDWFSRLMVYDDKDKEINFNRGKIFFEIVPTGNEVKY